MPIISLQLLPKENILQGWVEWISIPTLHRIQIMPISARLFLMPLRAYWQRLVIWIYCIQSDRLLKIKANHSILVFMLYVAFAFIVNKTGKFGKK